MKYMFGRMANNTDEYTYCDQRILKWLVLFSLAWYHGELRYYEVGCLVIH